MRKLLSAILALLMVVSLLAFVACGNDDTPDTPDTPSTPDTPDNPDTPDTPEDPANQRIELVLPERYYGGEEPFHILEWTMSGAKDPGTKWLPWLEGDATEEQDDLMSAAVFARNAYVEETYGVEITQEFADVNKNEHYLRVQQDNQVGSSEIQLVTTRAIQAWNFIGSNLLYDMTEIGDGIFHFDQPWWPQDAVASYALGDGIYICASEMLLRDKGATAALYFNPQIAENYGLGNLYDMVHADDWTLENMISACDVVATSLDGDDLMNSDLDQWGMIGPDDTSYYLYAAFGQKFAIMDDDGYLKHTFIEPESVTTMQKILDEVMYADWFYNSYINTYNFENTNAVFIENKALFLPAMIKTAYTDLRNMETDFGVLPMPKADYLQEDYKSLVWVHHDSVLGIPSATSDPEMAAIILEALSYEGYYTVTPVLLDTLIYGRLSKTQEARDCYELIFDTRVYDPGQYWISGGFTSHLLRHTATGNSNVVSVWETDRSSTEQKIQEVNDFIDGNY